MPLPDFYLQGMWEYGRPTIRRFPRLSPAGVVPRHNYPDVPGFSATVDASMPSRMAWARYFLIAQYRQDFTALESAWGIDMTYDSAATVPPYGIYAGGRGIDTEWVTTLSRPSPVGLVDTGLAFLPPGYQTIDESSDDGLGNVGGDHRFIEDTYVAYYVFPDNWPFQPFNTTSGVFVTRADSTRTVHYEVRSMLAPFILPNLSQFRPHTNTGAGDFGGFGATSYPGPSVNSPLTVEYGAFGPYPPGSVDSFTVWWGAPIVESVSLAFALAIVPVQPIGSGTIEIILGERGIRPRGRILGRRIVV
jgi:hypothetical protein